MKPVGPQEVESSRKNCESDKNRMFTLGRSSIVRLEGDNLRIRVLKKKQKLSRVFDKRWYCPIDLFSLCI